MTIAPITEPHLGQLCRDILADCKELESTQFRSGEVPSPNDRMRLIEAVNCLKIVLERTR